MKIPEENIRVKKLIELYSNGNENAFSKEIGVSQPRINRLFSPDPRSGKYPLLSFEIVQSIINKFVDVNLDWLISGKGPITKHDASTNYMANEPMDPYKAKSNLTELENQLKNKDEMIILLKAQIAILQDHVDTLKKRDENPKVNAASMVKPARM